MEPATTSEPSPLPLVRAERLSFRYPGAARAAVSELSLSIAAGELFGLLGPNGAGKTTTISILATLLRPTTGTVAIAGHDVVRQGRLVRRDIGLVPQEIALYPSLTARENLAYFGRLHGLTGGGLRDRIAECLAFVGLEEHADRRISEYSGGMKRRANLAAGILHRPRLLFLDEPTVGIDAQSRHTILAHLQALAGEGMTMVYTTHYMEEAEQLCSRVAIIDDGRILAEGAPAALVDGAVGCSNLEELFLGLTGKQLRD